MRKGGREEGRKGGREEGRKGGKEERRKEGRIHKMTAADEEELLYSTIFPTWF